MLNVEGRAPYNCFPRSRLGEQSALPRSTDGPPCTCLAIRASPPGHRLIARWLHQPGRAAHSQGSWRRRSMDLQRLSHARRHVRAVLGRRHRDQRTRRWPAAGERVTLRSFAGIKCGASRADASGARRRHRSKWCSQNSRSSDSIGVSPWVPANSEPSQLAKNLSSARKARPSGASLPAQAGSPSSSNNLY